MRKPSRKSFRKVKSRKHSRLINVRKSFRKVNRINPWVNDSY